jgi:hypothetical protein
MRMRFNFCLGNLTKSVSKSTMALFINIIKIYRLRYKKLA